MQDNTISDLDFRIPLDAVEENLEIEFKRELNLSVPTGKAKLAQEIGALCNFGGGWIVLGREDTGEYPPALPKVLATIDQDMINQIVSTYLVPAPHCTLRWLQPNGISFEVPVVKVPSVGTVPICGRKNGPQNERNRTVGVRKGVHYYRTAGPTSAPIDSPDQWQDVIRKCVLRDKTQLLGALTTMMQQPSTASASETKALDSQFEAIVDHWKEIASNPKGVVDPSVNFVAFGFELEEASDQLTISTNDILHTLQARTFSDFGPHRFFDEQMSSDNKPYVFEIGGVAGLRVDSAKDDAGNFHDLPYVWCLAENFTGVEILAFWEDTDWVQGAVEKRSSRKWERGKNFWPTIQMEYVDDFLSNIWNLGQAFGFNGQVRIRISYRGLAGRKLASANAGVHYNMKYVSRQDRTSLDLSFELAALEDSVRSSVVATVIQSINKFFQGPEITADSVVKSLNANRRR